MILIGQYDSPFVRRVAVTAALYGMPFEHRPWSVFGDADKVAQFSPARRVPILVLDDGEVVIESATILDALDQLAGGEMALTPASGESRRAVLKVCALATSLADKAVSLVYERLLHDFPSDVWTERCRRQVTALLDALESERAQRTTVWWFGGDMDQADVTLACVLRFVSEAHADVFDLNQWPALKAHSDSCESLPVFQTHAQAFHVTPPKSA